MTGKGPADLEGRAGRAGLRRLRLRRAPLRPAAVPPQGGERGVLHGLAQWLHLGSVFFGPSATPVPKSGTQIWGSPGPPPPEDPLAGCRLSQDRTKTFSLIQPQESPNTCQAIGKGLFVLVRGREEAASAAAGAPRPCPQISAWGGRAGCGAVGQDAHRSPLCLPGKEASVGRDRVF